MIHNPSILLLALGLYSLAMTAWWTFDGFTITRWRKRATYWQQECGEQVGIIAKIWPDAAKWRNARDRRKAGRR